MTAFELALTLVMDERVKPTNKNIEWYCAPTLVFRLYLRFTRAVGPRLQGDVRAMSATKNMSSHGTRIWLRTNPERLELNEAIIALPGLSTPAWQAVVDSQSHPNGTKDRSRGDVL